MERKFSNNKTSPGSILQHFQLLTETNFTGTPRTAEVVFKICFNEYFSSTFGLPK
jgi:hypothetical protein